MESYIQKLTPDGSARPIRVGEAGDSVAEPHWWMHPSNGTGFIVYSNRGVNLASEIRLEQYLNADGTFKSEIDGRYGTTYRIDVDLGMADVGAPRTLVFPRAPVEMIKFPFRGGISKDLQFLATGYQFTYLYRLQ
jgi:hypothetical protein